MKKHLNFKYELLPIILMCVIAFLFFGCSHTQSQVDRKKTTGIIEKDKIAVIINTMPYSKSSPYEQTIIKCISEGFKKLNKEVKILPAEKLRIIAFPDFRLSENSDTNKAIEHIIIIPPVLEKIKSMGIRYIVLVDEPQLSKFLHHEYSGWQAWEFTYGGWAGYNVEKKTRKTVSIHGEIFDIKNSCLSGDIYSSSIGVSYYNIYWVPIPLGFGWPSTASESKACKEFGEAVAKFIAGQETNE